MAQLLRAELRSRGRKACRKDRFSASWTTLWLKREARAASCVASPTLMSVPPRQEETSGRRSRGSPERQRQHSLLLLLLLCCLAGRLRAEFRPQVVRQRADGVADPHGRVSAQYDCRLNPRRPSICDSSSMPAQLLPSHALSAARPSFLLPAAPPIVCSPPACPRRASLGVVLHASRASLPLVAWWSGSPLAQVHTHHAALPLLGCAAHRWARPLSGAQTPRLACPSGLCRRELGKRPGRHAALYHGLCCAARQWVAAPHPLSTPSPPTCLAFPSSLPPSLRALPFA